MKKNVRRKKSVVEEMGCRKEKEGRRKVGRIFASSISGDKAPREDLHANSST